MCPKAPAPAPHHWEHDPGPTASGVPRALGTYCWQGVDPDRARGSFAPQDCPGIFSAGLDLLEMYGRDPAHCAEYWKAVQELWLRVYLSNLVVIGAINVSVPLPEPPHCLTGPRVGEQDGALPSGRVGGTLRGTQVSMPLWTRVTR